MRYHQISLLMILNRIHLNLAHDHEFRRRKSPLLKKYHYHALHQLMLHLDLTIICELTPTSPILNYLPMLSLQHIIILPHHHVGPGHRKLRSRNQIGIGNLPHIVKTDTLGQPPPLWMTWVWCWLWNYDCSAITHLRQQWQIPRGMQRCTHIPHLHLYQRSYDQSNPILSQLDPHHKV